jgi:peroxiredoxin
MNAYRDQYATLFNGGNRVTLLAVSVDSAEVLASWAREAEYPFLFLSDPEGVMGKLYGAYNAGRRTDNRSLFVIGPDGKIQHRQTPFREIDPAAYRELEAAVDRIAGAN